jgi:phage-related minor tail protein
MSDNIEVGNLVAKISFDDTGLNKSMAEIDRQMKLVKSEFDKASSALKNYGSEEERLKGQAQGLTQQMQLQQQRVNKLNEEFQKSAREKGEDAKATQDLAVKLNKAQTAYNNLENELKQVNTELEQQQKIMKGAKWSQVGDQLTSVGDKFKKAGAQMTNVGKNLSMSVTAPIVGLGTLATKSAIEFESAFAGVRKTVDATEAQFEELEKGIRDMAKRLPASASEIALVGEAAGQLGIKTESLLDFTEVMIGLGEATTMSSDQAATELARLANITKMNQGDFDKLGSSIVALGNNFATTEGEITAMALRLAGAGSQIGLSEADILGLSAALSSVGIEAEMGGSAISRVMVEMQMATSVGMSKVQELSEQTGMSLRDLQLMAANSGMDFAALADSLGMTRQEMKTIVDAGVDLENFAKIAGMSAAEFKERFEVDAIGAIGEFVNGLGNAEAAGESAINMLTEMGITEIRLRDSLLRAGGANELFAESIQVSNKAWDENIALQNEVAQRYGTTESQLKIFRNRMTEIGMQLGEVLIPVIMDVVDAIAPWIEKFASLSEESKKTMLVIGGIVAAIGPAILIIGQVASAIGSIISVVGTVSAAIGAAGGVASLFGTVLAALTGPIGWIIAGVAALTIGGIALYKHLSSDAIPTIERFGDEVSESTQKAVGAYFDLNDSATTALNELTWSSKTVSKEMADNLISTFDQMGDSILAEMEKDHQAQLGTITKFFADSSALTEEEEAAALAASEQNYTKRAAAIEQGQAKITEIMTKASEDNRALTQQEADQIKFIQESMVNTAVRVMSENELEQRAIMERMAANAGALSARQAADVVKNSAEQRDGAVSAAEEQYNDVLKEIIRQRDEVGSISKDQADRLIKDAQRQRDESVSLAEDMHNNILSNAKEKSGKHVNLIDWETGEILSKWQYYWNEHKALFNKMYKSFAKFWDDLAVVIREKTSEAVAWVKEKFEELKDWLNELPSKMKEIGVNVIQGLLTGIASKATEVVDAVKDIGKNLISGVKKVLDVRSPSRVMTKVGEDTGEGLAIGLDNKKATVSKSAEKLAKATYDSMKGWIDERKYYSELSLEQELKAWNDIASRYKAGSEQRKSADREIYRVKQEMIKAGLDAEKAAFDASKEWISERKYYNTLTLDQELKAWQRVQQQYKVGTEQRKQADREVYRVQQEILKDQQKSEKDAFDNSKKWISDKKEMSMLSLTQELAAWERVQARYAEGTEERKQADKEAAKVRQEIYTELKAASDDYLAKVQEVNTRVADEEKRLNEVYEQAVESRSKSIYSFAGLFDEVTRNAEVSGQQLIDNLRGQVDVMAEWAASLERLAARGVDDGLIAELQQMGPKAAAEIAALNGLTDTELSEYQFLWKSKNQLAREQAVEELEGLKNDTILKIQELNANAAIELNNLQKEFEKRVLAIRTGTKNQFNALTADMPKIGNNIIEGLIKGMDSMKGKLQSKASEMASSVSETIRKALDINSPSGVTMWLGEETGEGLVVGMGHKIAAIAKQARALSTAAIPSMGGVSGGSDPNVPTGSKGGLASGVFAGATMIFNVRNDNDIDAISHVLNNKYNFATRGAGAG